jgi:hypothetical protein
VMCGRRSWAVYVYRSVCCEAVCVNEWAHF